MGPAVEITADGSATLRSPLSGDTYHSMRGAVGETIHVYIEGGFRHRLLTGEVPIPVRILEVGFGTGLGAWLTLQEARREGVRVEYTAVELYPVETAVALSLGYTDEGAFAAMHTSPWGEWSEPSEGFRLLKMRSDFAETKLIGSFDVVYYDAFAPDTQPELWMAEIFRRLHGAMAPGGVVVTYSAKGEVRRAMQSAGFAVKRAAGALGKRHMLRATKG